MPWASLGGKLPNAPDLAGAKVSACRDFGPNGKFLPVTVLVTVHGVEALKIQAILDASVRKCCSNWARAAEKPRFRADFATFARERLPVLQSRQIQAFLHGGGLRFPVR